MQSLDIQFKYYQILPAPKFIQKFHNSSYNIKTITTKSPITDSKQQIISDKEQVTSNRQPTCTKMRRQKSQSSMPIKLYQDKKSPSNFPTNSIRTYQTQPAWYRQDSQYYAWQNTGDRQYGGKGYGQGGKQNMRKYMQYKHHSSHQTSYLPQTDNQQTTHQYNLRSTQVNPRSSTNQYRSIDTKPIAKTSPQKLKKLYQVYSPSRTFQFPGKQPPKIKPLNSQKQQQFLKRYKLKADSYFMLIKITEVFKDSENKQYEKEDGLSFFRGIAVYCLWNRFVNGNNGKEGAQELDGVFPGISNANFMTVQEVEIEKIEFKQYNIGRDQNMRLFLKYFLTRFWEKKKLKMSSLKSPFQVLNFLLKYSMFDFILCQYIMELAIITKKDFTTNISTLFAAVKQIQTRLKISLVILDYQRQKLILSSKDIQSNNSLYLYSLKGKFYYLCNCEYKPQPREKSTILPKKQPNQSSTSRIDKSSISASRMEPPSLKKSPSSQVVSLTRNRTRALCSFCKKHYSNKYDTYCDSCYENYYCQRERKIRNGYEIINGICVLCLENGVKL